MNDPDLPTREDGRVDTDLLTDWIVTQVRAALPTPTTTIRLAQSVIGSVAPSSRGLAMIHRHLREHPDALSSGQSDLSPVMTKLITALVDAGTGAVLPVCSRCQRPARLPQVVDGGRTCPACVDVEHQQACSRCGRRRPVATRDQSGPICPTCRARDPAHHEPCGVCGRTARVHARDHAGGAVCARCRRAQREPEPCCRCRHRAVPAARTTDGPVCQRCYHRPAQRCDACGRVRPLAVRRRDGQPALCSGCHRGTTAVCSACGRTRPTKRCTARNGEPTCASCWPRPERACARCGKVKPVLTRWPIGDVCAACYAWVRKHPAVCAHCGMTRPLIGRDRAGQPVCGPCTGYDDLDYACPRCGESGFAQHAGRCLHCEADDRIHELLADHTGAVRPELKPFAAALARADSADAILQWLRPGQPATRLLEQLRDTDQPISHNLLDELPPGLAVHRLRQTFVHTGVLPDRADYLERLEPWLDQLLADQPADRAHLIRTYTQWHLLRRARHRTRHRDFTPGANNWARTRVSAVLGLLRWLDQHHLDLATARQGHIDQWLTAGHPESTYPARDFLTWARQRHLTGDLRIPKKQSRTTLAPITEDERWQQLHRCLHDATLPMLVRAGGCLVLLYGLPVSRVTALRHDDIHADTKNRTWLRIGGRRLRLPPAVAGLVLAQRDQATAVSAVARAYPGDTAWLFPGGFPGRPARDALYRALRTHLHVHLRRARSAALVALAADLPAAVLADLLGIHINTALAWSAYAQTDWAAYLAARHRGGQPQAGSATRRPRQRQPWVV